jgi:glutathione peroxidase
VGARRCIEIPPDNNLTSPPSMTLGPVRPRASANIEPVHATDSPAMKTAHPLALLSALLVAFAAWSAAPAWAQSAAAADAACPALLQKSFPRLQDEKPQSLCQYSGKVLLVVNTASYCGFTPQYEGLEALHAKYVARGLVVMGFPSNDFHQESDDPDKIADLCFNTYGVKFPMFTLSAVRGKDANPLFAQLAQATGASPSWNFNKYLVDRQGRPVAHYGSTTRPDSTELVGAIEKALAAK